MNGDSALVLSGVAVQTVGYVWAGALLVRLREKTTGRPSTFRVCARRLRIWATAFRQWFALVVLRKEPQTTNAEATPEAIAMAFGGGEATGKAGMPGGLTVDKRIEWLEDRLSKLGDDLAARVLEEASARDRAVAEIKAEARQAIDDAANEARRDVRDLVGADLGWELWAVGLVVVGTWLTAFGAL